MDFIKLTVLSGENQIPVDIIIRTKDIDFIEPTGDGKSLVATYKKDNNGDPVYYLSSQSVEDIYDNLNGYVEFDEDYFAWG